MPKDLKENIIARNLHRLAQIERLLFLFGLIMITVCLIRFKGDYKAHINDFLYYCSYVFTSVHVFITAIIVVRHRNWPLWVRNTPTHLAIIEILIICFIAMKTDTGIITMYTIYINVCILTILLLAVEPLFINTFLIIYSIFLAEYVYRETNTYLALNVLLTSFVICTLQLYKWSSLIKEFRLEKIRDNHIDNMEKEIQLAAFVQESFTNNKIPALEGFEISYYSKAMAGVSGDMYEIFIQDNKLNGLGVFDVSGHGIASGLVTMLVRNIIQQEFDHNKDKDLTETVSIIDNRIKEEKHGIENYLTGLLLRINNLKKDSAEFEIVNAGHPCPIIYKKSENKCSFFDEKRQFSSSVIGLSSIDSFYRSTTFELKSGDEIILYTDGIKEASNKEHKEFGNQRIIESVQNAMAKDFNSQYESILNNLGIYIDNEDINDDITIVILKKK